MRHLRYIAALATYAAGEAAVFVFGSLLLAVFAAAALFIAGCAAAAFVVGAIRDEAEYLCALVRSKTRGGRQV
jgi:hypothetical protein